MKKTPKTILYCWRGKNQAGQRLKGEQSVANPVLLRASLRRQGVSEIKVRKKSITLFRSRSLKATDLTAFSRQIATLLTAGIPLLQALEVISRSCKPAMQMLVITLKDTIAAGSTVAETLRKYPQHFNTLYCSLVAAGEKIGALDVMFERIAFYKEKTDFLKGKIKKALFYPAAVLIVATAVLLGMLIFVIPQFETLFVGFGASLPLPTRILIKGAHFFQQKGWLFIVLLPLVIAIIKMGFRYSPALVHSYDRWLLKFPIIGNILAKTAIARFARTLATSYAAGLPLLEALTLVADAAGNRLYEQAIIRMRMDVAAGQVLHQSMRQAGLFPSIAIQMVAIGEESGTLEVMLNKIAGVFEEDVANIVASFSSLLEPIIMVVLGVVIGGLVIAMYLPIFKLGSVV